jgi:hypothetical protein
VTDYSDADCLPFSIRLTAARKRALERVAAEVGMSAPQFVEAMLARLVAEGGDAVEEAALILGWGGSHCDRRYLFQEDQQADRAIISEFRQRGRETCARS